MLKILTEQELGFPTELVQDGDSPEIPSNLTGPASVYEALESGAVHMYPEVARDTFLLRPASSSSSLQCRLQTWRSEDPALYEAYVLDAQSVRLAPRSHSPLYSVAQSRESLVQVVSVGALGPLGRNGLYCRNDDVDRFPALAGWRGLNDSAVRAYFGGRLYAFVPGWGPVEEILLNLGLHYKVVFLGIEAAMTIRSRLQAGLPTLFYLPLVAALAKRAVQFESHPAAAVFYHSAL
jgi:hypothetical protein